MLVGYSKKVRCERDLLEKAHVRGKEGRALEEGRGLHLLIEKENQ